MSNVFSTTLVPPEDLASVLSTSSAASNNIVGELNSDLRLGVEELREIFIYDDGLDPNWTLEYSEDMRSEPLNTYQWFEVMDEDTGIHSGAASIRTTPTGSWGRLFFTIRPDSLVEYSRDQILGISFWVNSGNNYLNPDELLVTIVGSNQYNYWSPDDEFAFLNGEGYFPEIPLYDLGINESLPPDTWVQVYLWMDKLLIGAGL